MNFIIPQNYNLKNKFLGFLDYSTLFINLIWIYFIFCITSWLILPLYLKICIIIICCFPLILFSILGTTNETILQIIIYLIKYFFKPKLYLFYK